MLLQLYLIGITLVGIAAVILIQVLYPDRNNVALIATTLGLLAPALLSLIAIVKVAELSHEINSRMTELVEATRGRADAEGRADERRQISRDDRLSNE